MLKKSDKNSLYNYCNADGVLLTLQSDYTLFSNELKSINVEYENRTIDEIIKELEEIYNLYFIFFHNDYDADTDLDDIADDIDKDEDFIKINFLIDYLKNLKLFCEEKIE